MRDWAKERTSKGEGESKGEAEGDGEGKDEIEEEREGEGEGERKGEAEGGIRSGERNSNKNEYVAPDIQALLVRLNLDTPAIVHQFFFCAGIYCSIKCKGFAWFVPSVRDAGMSTLDCKYLIILKFLLNCWNSSISTNEAKGKTCLRFNSSWCIAQIKLLYLSSRAFQSSSNSATWSTACGSGPNHSP